MNLRAVMSPTEMLETANEVMQQQCAEQAAHIHKLENGIGAMAAAVDNAAWVLNPWREFGFGGLDERFPTLAHLMLDYVLDFSHITEETREHCRLRVKQILSSLALGERKLSLECWKCGAAKSRCQCCATHRWYESKPNDCADCSPEAARA